MRINLKMLRVFFFVVFLFLGITSGQIAVNQEEADLSTISEKQREFLLERAKYFREFENQKLSGLLCKDGKFGLNYRLTFDYNHLDINPCIKDEKKITKEILMQNLQKLNIDKSALVKQRDKSKAKNSFNVRQIQQDSSKKIVSIGNKAQRDSEGASPSQIEEINLRAERETRAITEITNKYIVILKNEIKSLENAVYALDSQEKGIIANLMILSENNPNMRIDKNIKAQFKIIEREVKGEIVKKKIDSGKEHFVGMSSRTSATLTSQTDYFFKSVASELSSGNYGQAAKMLEAVAMAADRDIEIVIFPDTKDTKVVIKWRECRAGAVYREERVKERKIEKLPMYCKFKIRVVSETGAHRCYVYGFDEIDSVKFNFDSNEKLCGTPYIPIEEDKAECP